MKRATLGAHSPHSEGVLQIWNEDTQFLRYRKLMCFDVNEYRGVLFFVVDAIKAMVLAVMLSERTDQCEKTNVLFFYKPSSVGVRSTSSTCSRLLPQLD